MGDACSKCFKLLERGLMGFAHVFTLVAAAVRSGKGFYSYFTHTERKGLHRSSAHFQSVKSRPGHRFNAFQRTNICFTSEGLYSYQTPLGMFGHEFPGPSSSLSNPSNSNSQPQRRLRQCGQPYWLHILHIWYGCIVLEEVTPRNTSRSEIIEPHPIYQVVE